VILWGQKGGHPDNQLWFEDRFGNIRSKLDDDNILDPSGGLPKCLLHVLHLLTSAWTVVLFRDPYTLIINMTHSLFVLTNNVYYIHPLLYYYYYIYIYRIDRFTTEYIQLSCTAFNYMVLIRHHWVGPAVHDNCMHSVVY